MFKKLWSFIVGIFATNENFKDLLGYERYELIRALVIEADRFGGMTGEQKRQWVLKELTTVIHAHGKTLVNWAVENILLELKLRG